MCFGRALSAGVAHISGNVWDARTDLDRGSVWELWLTQGSSSTQLAGGLLYGNDLDGITRASPALFDFADIPLSPQDTVMLKLYRTGTGDFVGVNLRGDLAAPIPEPKTGVLVLLGLTLLFLFTHCRNLLVPSRPSGPLRSFGAQ